MRVHATFSSAILAKLLNFELTALVYAVLVHGHCLEAPLDCHVVIDEENLEGARLFKVVGACLQLPLQLTLSEYDSELI